MGFMKSTFICPYCFEKHKLSEVQFRCINRRCNDVDDVEMTRYENGNLKSPSGASRCSLRQTDTTERLRQSAPSAGQLPTSGCALPATTSCRKAP